MDMLDIYARNDELKDTQRIPIVLLQKIKEIVMHDPHVIALTQTLVAQLMGSGIDFFITTPVGKKPADGNFQKYIDRELVEFVKEFIINSYMFGFDVSIPSESRYAKGLKIPIHPRLGDWELVYGYKNSIRKYSVYRTDRFNNRELWEDAMVSIIFAPTDEGQLTAPLYVALKHIMLLNNLMNDVENTSHNIANPPLITEIKSNTSTKIDVGDATKFAKHDFLDETFDIQQKMNENDFDELQKAKALAYRIKTGMVQFDGNNVVQKNNDNVNIDFSLPRNQTIARQIQPQTISNIDNMIEVIMNQISNILGVSSKLNSTKTAYSANVELDLKIVNDRLSFVRNVMTAQLEQLFETLWKSYLKAEKTKIVETIKKENNLSYLSKKIHGTIKANIGIEITFKYIPIADLDRIIELHERGLFDYDVFSDTVIKMVGMPLSSKSKKNPSQGMLGKRSNTDKSTKSKQSKLNYSKQEEEEEEEDEEEEEEEVKPKKTKKDKKTTNKEKKENPEDK